MAGNALSLFTDFFTHTTGPAELTGPERIVNDAQIRNYEGLHALFRARKEIQGGNEIQDQIILDDPGTATTYYPDEPATITNTQTTSTIKISWRFTRVPITWTEQELLLNGGGDNVNRGAQFHQFKRLRDAKYSSAYVSLMNLCEKKITASANNANMESSTGKEPYSVFAFCTGTNSGAAPTGFTNVMNINPTSKSNWRNQYTTYTASSLFDPDVGLIGGFDDMSQRVRFRNPPRAEEYFEDDILRRMVIATNMEGRRDFMKAIRAVNDITRSGPQDPAYGTPVFLGFPVQHWDSLDENSSFSANSPDFLWLNMNYIKMIFHAQKFMKRGEVMGWADRPSVKVVWVDVYWNAICQSRKRQGYLAAA